MRFAGVLVVMAGLVVQAGQAAPTGQGAKDAPAQQATKDAPAAPSASPFAGVRSLSCSFPVYATANLAGMPPQPTSRQQDFTFTIDTFDLKKSRVRIVGSGGSAPAALVSTPIGITVIEQTQTGNVNMTTVFAAGGHDDTRLAVHSRHIGDPTSLPSVSQAYGTCVIQK